LTIHYSLNLSKRILLPISLSLMAILIVGILAFQIQYRSGISGLANERLKNIEGQIQEEIRHKTKILSSLLLLLKNDIWIGEHLSGQNRSALLNDSRNKLQQVHDNLGISHLYFSNLNRVNILRVHNPDRWGDIIDRFTTLEAQRTGEIFSGLELGPYGTYTLRAVAPWEYQQKRVGYVELGIDASLLLNEIALQNDTGLILSIVKTALTRQKWQEGQALMGYKPDWDKFRNMVISSWHGLSEHQLANIPELEALNDSEINTEFIQQLDNDFYVWREIEVKDVLGRSLGKLFLSINITDWIHEYKVTGISALIIYLFIASLLMTTLYKLAQRTQKAETQLQLTKNQFENLASYDQVAELPNRQLFKKELLMRIEESRRFDQIIAIAFIDLDHFKNINDTLGHDQGDLLIKLAGHRISQLIREYDVLARFGGDEFVLMMPNITSESDVISVMDKILLEMNQPLELGKEMAHITISAGISLFPADAVNVGELIRYADVAMYEAKKAGRNTYRFFTRQTNDRLLRRQIIENLLREAISNQHFELYYQPLINLTTNQITSYEALIRWFPDMDSPPTTEELITIAEQSNLIIDIGNWVIASACQQSSLWKQKKHPHTKININISGRQLLHLDIYEVIVKNINKYQLAFTDIGIELTENVLIQANDILIENLQKLIDAGVEISLDDFGTGYSSLSYLKKFPLSTVKIDREFVRNAQNDPDDRAIIQAIIAMGHSIGLKIVAEGVETKAHYDLVKQAGCDFAQGYYIQKPVAVKEILSDPITFK